MNGHFLLYWTCQGGRSSQDLLLRAASVYTGEKETAFCSVRDKWKKPYFSSHPGLHFSVSHSGGIWICAMGSEEVGLDIQEHKNANSPAISRRYFHPTEDAFLRANHHQDFFAVWTAKESYCKYLGVGIDETFSKFSVVQNGALSDQVQGVQLRSIAFYPGFSLCLCAKTIQSIRLCSLFAEDTP